MTQQQQPTNNNNNNPLQEPLTNEPPTTTTAYYNNYQQQQQPLNYYQQQQPNYNTPNYYQQQQPYQQPLNYNNPPLQYQQQQPYLPHPPPPPPPQQQQPIIYNSSPLRPHHHHHINKPSAYNNSPQTTPFGSPKPHHHHHHHWKNNRHHIRSPASPRHPPPLFSPRSPYSSTSSPSTQGPQSPSSLPPIISHQQQQHQQPLLRGSLAQAKLRGHPIPTNSFKPEHIPFATLSLQHTPPHHQQHHHHHHHNKTALPKPPIHSQHALWVGNIPNDASHEELWKFFSAQPITTPTFKQQQLTGGAGVESIHLIARSNCAFVNYLSHAHLNQAISLCNGKPLRPLDPYCKPLLCRIRKPEDNIKSGVGAQRIGGLHRSWVKRSADHPPSSHHNQFNKHRHTLPPSSTTTQNTKNLHNNNNNRENIHQQQQQHSNSLNEPSTTNLRTSSTLTAASNQSQSTTSSFLASHFPRRYFILKAYTDEDLRISVDRSIWVSQAHNEPILDQAYRTSGEGVFLIFSANQSGSFFGYARMAGPIAGVRGRRQSLPPASPPTEASIKAAAGRTRSASIGTPDRALEGLFVDLPPSASPRALSPVLPELPLRWPGSPVRRSLPILGPPRTPQSVLQPSSTISNTTTPTLTKDPHSTNTTLPFTSPLLSHDHHQLIPDAHPAQILVQDRNQQSTHDDHHDNGDEEDDDEDDEDKLMSGKPFKVEWIRVQKLSFYRTKNLRNPFNGNREVKVSRDGTEVEPSIGAAIVAEIENEFNRHHHQHHHQHHQIHQVQQDQQIHHHQQELQQPIQQHQHHHTQPSSSSSGLPALQDQHFQA
ncbi:hypothetical protein PGT21_033614 [Puccinia graminis f. sp. tritici]|uniref:YTH domain-containing protein n=1 Tax=Puccinia graminis f. sp. tritici TaxID=56615 RepID=A0A5B0PAI3_PUCGR|nr:hypothetical protein PGT21_033614 [Puccinia graminis f. sp. tritici]KAA1125600.1 hypothetical protein PGTUg99_008095 [Puccinia graminis f. sp. tritici]